MYMNNVRTFWVDAFKDLGYLNPPGLYMAGIVDRYPTFDPQEKCTCICGCEQINDSTDTEICISCSEYCQQYICSCCSKEAKK